MRVGNLQRRSTFAKLTPPNRLLERDETFSRITPDPPGRALRAWAAESGVTTLQSMAVPMREIGRSSVGAQKKICKMRIR
jgi:hypothetical protein